MVRQILGWSLDLFKTGVFFRRYMSVMSSRIVSGRVAKATKYGIWDGMSYRRQSASLYSGQKELHLLTQ